MNKRIEKIINFIFIGSIFLFLTGGFIKTVFFPDKINEYENRNANKIEKFTFPSYFNGSYQNSVDAALSDNVFLATTMKKLYNITNSSVINSSIKLFNSGDDYISLGSVHLFGDYLVYGPGKIEWQSDLLIKRCSLYNEMAEKYKDTEFFVFYVERDTDINLKTGEKVGTYECIRDNLKIPQKNISRFEISSFKDFSESYFKTDHHWNADGSYRGYTRVLELLSPESQPLKIIDKVKLNGSFSGAKTLDKATASYSEDFYVNRFDFPEMTVYINGETYDNLDYGQQNYYKDEEKANTESPKYSHYYGDDYGEIVFDMNSPEKENILVIGESYDNAILKLLATHFNKTHSVDLRYYLNYMGKEFNFSEYIKENNIDKVLFIGAVDYFVLDSFIVE